MILEQISENERGVLNGSVLGHPSNRRTANFVSEFTHEELTRFGVDGIGHASATSPLDATSNQKNPYDDDRGTSNAPVSASGWNDPDVMSTASQNRGSSTLTDPELNGTSRTEAAHPSSCFQLMLCSWCLARRIQPRP